MFMFFKQQHHNMGHIEELSEMSEKLFFFLKFSLVKYIKMHYI